MTRPSDDLRRYDPRRTARQAAVAALSPLALCIGCGQTTAPAGKDLSSSSADTARASRSPGSDRSAEAARAEPSTAATTYVVVGAGAWEPGSGKIYVFEVNRENGLLDQVSELDDGTLNSFGAISSDGTRLYMGDEVDKRLRAYSIDRSSGELSPTGEQTLSDAPVYVHAGADGSYVFTASYRGGSAQVTSVAANGQLEGVVDSVASGAQSHAIVLDPAGNYAFVPSKGENKIAQYAFDATTGKLVRNTVASVAQEGGPRHLDFHPSGQFAYGVNELANTITAYRYDSSSGRLEPVESLDMRPPGFVGDSAAADVNVAPDGHYVYATNRAAAEAGSLAIFAIDGDSGRLTLVGHESTRGRPPRQFGIHPNGRFLLVANHESSDLALFRISEDDGKLAYVRSYQLDSNPYWVGYLVVSPRDAEQSAQ